MPFLMHTLQILRNRHPLDIYLTFSPAWTDKIQLTMKNGDFFSGPRCREIIILDKKGKKDKPLCSLKSLRPGLESKVGRCPFSRTTVLRRPLALLRFIARFWVPFAGSFTMGLGRLHRDSRVPRSLGGKKSSELSSVVYLENEHEKVGLSPATECVLFVAVTPRSFSLLT